MNDIDPDDWTFWLRIVTAWARVVIGLLGVLSARATDRRTRPSASRRPTQDGERPPDLHLQAAGGRVPRELPDRPVPLVGGAPTPSWGPVLRLTGSLSVARRPAPEQGNGR